MSPLLGIFILQKNAQNFEGRVEPELVGTAPTLESSDADAGLRVLAQFVDILLAEERREKAREGWIDGPTPY